MLGMYSKVKRAAEEREGWRLMVVNFRLTKETKK